MSKSNSQSAAQAHTGRLTVVLGLTASYMAVEVVGGLATGSLALIADAGHMLTDVLGVSAALIAIRFAAKPATQTKTYGYYRLEILAALANGFLLLGVGVYILWEAYRRLSEPPSIQGAEMTAIAAVGLLVNTTSAYLLFEGQQSSLNLRGAFLEVLSDLLGSVAVIAAGVLIVATGFQAADVVASLFIGILVVPRTWSLISDALHVLLEGTPAQVDLGHVTDHVLSTSGVVGLHDLHVWSLTSGVDVMSAHVLVEENADDSTVLDELKTCLLDHFDIDHSTFQIEHRDRERIERASHR